MMKELFWYGVNQLFRKKTISMLTVIMLAVSFILMQYAGVKYVGYRYSEWKAKSVVKYDFDDVYNINMFRYAFGGVEEIELLTEFYVKFNDIDGIAGYGILIEEDNAEEDITYLYISGSLLKLCGIDNCFSDDENAVMVGNKLVDEYPLGSEVTDYLLSNEIKYTVKAVMDEGSKFISEQYIDVRGKLIDLDYSLVFDLDKFVDRHKGFIMQAMVNNFYFIAEDNADKDKIIKDINLLADELGVKIYGINSMEDLFAENAMYAAESMGETYLMPFVMTVCAFVSLVIATFISIRSSRCDMGIMLANGFTCREGALVYIYENIIKIIFSYLVSVVYWSVNFGKFIDEQELIRVSLKANVFVVIAITLLSSIVPIIYINNRKPCELIGKRYD